MNFQRRRVVIAVVGVVAVALIGLGAQFARVPAKREWLRHVDFETNYPPYVMDYPHARDIELGMTKAQIRVLLGPPTSVDHRNGHEVWNYRFFGWGNGIHVRFDASDRVEYRDWEHG
jgi:hypothetical protein